MTNWYDISRISGLTEEFILENKLNVRWHLICSCQRLSEEFIWKHEEYINFGFLIENKYLALYSLALQENIVNKIFDAIQLGAYKYDDYLRFFTPYMLKLYEKYMLLL